MNRTSGMFFVLCALPINALLLGLTLHGYSLGKSHLPTNMAIPVLLLVLLLYIAATLFVGAGGWRSLLNPAFAYAVGLGLSFFFTDSSEIYWPSIGWILLGGLSLAFGIGKLVGLSTATFRRPLRWLTWTYLLGWVGILLFALPQPYRRGWAGFGWLIFFGLAVDWFSQYPERALDTLASELTFELYLLSLNLALTSGILFA